MLSSLRGYRRSWLTGDLIAAVTLLAIALPEQLATSRLAGMPPITGIYAFIAGSAGFALLGSNPQMSVGADSTIAPLIAVGVAQLARSSSVTYVELAAILAVLVGVILVLVWLLRLGWMAEFLSAPIITGFLAGIAIVIVVHQLPDLLGLPAGHGGTVGRVRAVINHLGDANLWSLALGLTVFAIVFAAGRIDRRLPGALIGLVVSTLAVVVFELHRSHGVEVLGTIAHGPPHFGLSGASPQEFVRMAPLAAVVALVVVTQTAATTRAFADEGGYEVNVSRDFLGVGAGNLVAGLGGSFPVNASPPRTAVVAAAAGRTQLAGLFAAAAMIALVPAGGVLRDLPLAALAGVLLFVATRIFHGRELVSIARFDAIELGLAIVTMLTVAVVGVTQGIGVAVGLAILDRARLSARPQLHVLGRIPGTTSWAPVSNPKHPTQVPGVLCVLFATPLWYGNAAQFHAHMRKALKRASGEPKLVVLDAVGMSDIDYTGARALRAALDELDRRGITFAVARAGEHLRAGLARSSLLARIGETQFFPTVDEAATALGGVGPPEPEATPPL